MKNPRLILEEVKNHLEMVKYESEKIEEFGLSEENFESRDFLMLLDAFIFRFIKLQSALGEKLFPLVFEILTGKPYTEVTFIDILNTLEKYGVIPSAQEWKRLRKLRNEFVHIYPWETDLKVEAVREALSKIPLMESVVKKIEGLINEKGSLI